MLTAPAMTLLFLGVVFGLGAAFMWMFWEIEQEAAPQPRPLRRGRHTLLVGTARDNAPHDIARCAIAAECDALIKNKAVDAV